MLGVTESSRQLTLLFILHLGIFFFHILLEKLSGLPTKSAADQVAYLFQQVIDEGVGLFVWVFCFVF